MKNPLADKNEAALQRNEEEGLAQARVLLEQRQKLQRIRYCCPHCQQWFEPKTAIPLFRVTKTWEGNGFVFTRKDPLLLQSPLPAMPRRFRKREADTLLTILGALLVGNPAPFFDALRRWPEILLEKEVWDRTVGTWHKQKVFKTPEGTQARKNLKRVGSMLADTVGAPQWPTDEERMVREQESNRKSKREFDARQRKSKKA